MTAGAPTSDDRVVLLIDEDREARGILHREMTAAGFRVAGVPTGSAGLEFVRRLRPDAVVMDIMLADATGWSVLASLKSDSTLASVPVIIYDVIPEAGLVFSLSIADYLVKPLDGGRLAGLLEKYATTSNPVLAVSQDVNVHRLLAQMSRPTTLALNALDALYALCTTPIDVVLVDLTLPAANVFSTFETLQEREVKILGLIPADPSPEQRRSLDAVVQRLLGKGGLRVEAFVRELGARLSRPS